MKLTILIARLGHETKVAIVHAGNQAGLAMVAQVLDQLYPDATIIILTEHGLNVYARTVKEIVDDHATANRIANLPQHADSAKGQIQRGKLESPKTFADIGPDYHAKLEAEVGAREQAQSDTRAIEGLGAALVEVMEERHRTPPPRNPDADDDEPAAAPRRRTDDDEVARP